MRRLRRDAEWALRALLILALLFAIRHALFAINEGASRSIAGGESRIRTALAGWSSASSPQSVHLVIDSVLSRKTLDWAADLRGAGTTVTWTSPLPALGIAVEPIVDPRGTSRVLIAAPAKSNVALSDSLGAIDSVTVRAAGASAGPLIVHGSVHAAAGGAVAVSARTDSLAVRPVLVLGRAGWEGKFVLASLQEYGWKVNARLNVAPDVDVAQSLSSTAVDTSLYSAVVVLDSSAARFAPAIERFVRSGGGLVAIGEGASLGALQGILPATAGDPLPAGELSAARPRGGFAMRPLINLRSDAVILEKRGARVAAAARRAGNGRVVQVGYEDTWRWRMAGSGDAVEDYRNWLSSVVSGAAYGPAIPTPAPPGENAAPLAELYSSLGSPRVDAAHDSAGSEEIMLDLFILAIGALVLETASRRLDGKP